MVEHLNIDQLPHVDGIPTEGQDRIDWIKNGECLSAAPTQNSNEGVLNRAPVAIQKNVVHLFRTAESTTGKVNELVDQVNNINTALGAVGDHSVIQLLNDTVERVTTNENNIHEVTNAIQSANNRIDGIDSDIGNRDPLDVQNTRTIHGELFYLKQEIGSYPGFDLNGKPSEDNSGSGLKYRVISNTSALNDHGQRILKLENDWQASDVGELTETVAAIRREIGNTNLATQDNIYMRLRTNARNLANVSNEVTEIKRAILFDSVPDIGTKVTDLSDKYTRLDREVNSVETGLRPRIQILENKIGKPDAAGSIDYRLTVAESSVDRLSGIVGLSQSDGLQHEVVQLQAQIGMDSDRHTIAGRLKLTETGLGRVESAVQDLENSVGDRNNGLIAGVLKLSIDMYGTEATEDDFARKGVIRVLKEVQTAVGNSTTDVPNDGLHYIRKHGEWVQVAYAAGAFKNTGQIGINLESQDTYKFIPLDLMTPEVPLREMVKGSNTVTVNDKGTFRVDFRATMTHVTNSTFVLAITKNDTVVFEAGNGYYGLDDKVSYSTAAFINIEKGDEIAIKIKGVSAEAVAQPVEITEFLFGISPV